MRRLPFLPRFSEPILEGEKTMTARVRKYPEGELLATPWGDVIAIRSVVKLTLQGVRDLYWREEGCESKEDFQRVWESIHPLAGFRPDQVVFLHQFEVVTPRIAERAPEAGMTEKGD